MKNLIEIEIDIDVNRCISILKSYDKCNKKAILPLQI